MGGPHFPLPVASSLEQHQQITKKPKKRATMADWDQSQLRVYDFPTEQLLRLSYTDKRAHEAIKSGVRIIYLIICFNLWNLSLWFYFAGVCAWLLSRRSMHFSINHEVIFCHWALAFIHLSNVDTFNMSVAFISYILFSDLMWPATALKSFRPNFCCKSFLVATVVIQKWWV